MGNSSNYFIVITNCKQLLHRPHDKTNVFRLKATINANIPTSIYLLKVNNGNTRTMSEICPKLTIETPK